MEVSKLHWLKKKKQEIEKKIAFHSLHGNEQKVPHKIVREINSMNVKRVYLINKLIINKN